MTKYELVKAVASRTKLSQEVCGKVIDEFLAEMKECLLNGEKLIIANMFSLEPYTSAGRTIKNVNTGKVEQVPDKVKLKLKVSRSFKSELNEDN